MRIVIALGGKALLRRWDPVTADVQRHNIAAAVKAIAPLTDQHSVVVVHGNGPQVGLQSARGQPHQGADPYPLDVLDAGAQGMIGYLIQQEMQELLPDRQVATLLTMIEVDPDDPAFARPAEFAGPGCSKKAADALAAEKSWTFGQDGAAWRRLVPSPEPRRILPLQPITWLLDRRTVVICAAGGGIPTRHPSTGHRGLVGAEAVIHTDLAAGLLAENVRADLLIMATDVDGVYLGWGLLGQRRLDKATVAELAHYRFEAGSMGPKVTAATRFSSRPGHRVDRRTGGHHRDGDREGRHERRSVTPGLNGPGSAGARR
jgi:carbamate kinase